MTVGPETGRPLREADWPRVRELLVDGLAVTAPGFLWDVRRWDGWRYYQPDSAWDPRWEREARAWEDRAGALLAVAHREGPDDLHLQVHPAHRHLEPAMVAWAEDRLAGAGERRLVTPVMEYDRGRQRLLEARGWQPTDAWGVTRWRHLGVSPVRRLPLAPGYALRTLRPGRRDDALRVARILNAAFGRTGHDAPEFLTFERHAPSYDPALHLVAETADGSFAAHVGVTLDRVNRLAIVEPVCTHPDHRRHGLAEALLGEGLDRARAAGATRACLETGAGEAANRLYDAAGFLEVFVRRDWEWRS